MFYFDIIKDKNKDKKILKSSILAKFEPKFKHLFTTKESFVKTKEENLKDDANSNLELILANLKIEKEKFFKIKQTHSTNIVINPENTDIIDDTDGIILSKPNAATILHFADCTPVLLYDPKNHIATGLHAGWRGTAGAISRLGVKLMEEKFGTNSKDIVAAIGPCIGQEDFETGFEVYEALKNTVKDTNGLFKFKETPESPLAESFSGTIKPGGYQNIKVFPDLTKINERQLTEAGVKTVDICQFKTYKDNDILFSYRRENKTTSRISMVLKLC